MGGIKVKLLVFADSHTDVATMLAITKAECPDTILHLGDHIMDGMELKNNCNVPVYLVKGNTDKAGDDIFELFLTFENTAVYMTHGHLFNGYEELTAKGIETGANIVLFGHTHQPYLCFENGVWLMNPGRVGCISSKRVHPTYGVIHITDGRVRCEIAEVAYTEALQQ
jgi:putative phosphoesterase